MSKLAKSRKAKVGALCLECGNPADLDCYDGRKGIDPSEWIPLCDDCACDRAEPLPSVWDNCERYLYQDL